MTLKDKTDVCFGLADRLESGHDLSDDELASVLLSDDPCFAEYIAGKARTVRERIYGRDVYLRGLIEFTNYCKKNCRYCGIRRDNRNADRYRMSDGEILACCGRGYSLGFRTFVLQGGEDPYFTDERVVSVIRKIRDRYPDAAITLSIGERERESYRKFREAGAERYLLRHETADRDHYNMLHPAEMSYDHRMQCLRNLRGTGFQVGCGMMVGSPYQTVGHLIKDIRFLQEFRPEMVGIGPFIPHHDTEFADHGHGSLTMTIRLISVIRLILPDALIPATTALGTVDPTGREQGLCAGANVVMPNLSTREARRRYLLYDNKICTGEDAAECVRCISARVARTGYHISETRGDHIRFRQTDRSVK